MIASYYFVNVSLVKLHLEERDCLDDQSAFFIDYLHFVCLIVLFAQQGPFGNSF